MNDQDIYQRALSDPASIFDTPEEVVEDPRLSSRQKVEILSRWAYDCAELSVAEEEGMTAAAETDMGWREGTDMGAVIRALDQLASPDLQRSAPTKHAGFRARHRPAHTTTPGG